MEVGSGRVFELGSLDEDMIDFRWMVSDVMIIKGGGEQVLKR